MKCFKNCRWQNKFLSFLLLLTFTFALPPSTAYAALNPLAVSNNKYGVHILTDNKQDVEDAAALVNSSGGDWGYITLLIESNNRDLNRWQNFFNILRRKHLIPIVRIATKPVNAHWEVPYEGEEVAVADFLDKLVWPTKNSYVVIYNEPNHGQEWGKIADPASYAKILDKTIDALKNKSSDFFVLNAGLDASTHHEPPDFYDEEKFLTEMNQAVPGIFNKLDGWVSHSYPNPGFKGKPIDTGKSSIRGYLWELEILKKLGVTKELPVFVTETGWKHSEGLKRDTSYPNVETVATYYKQAFSEVWSDPKIVAVTPFILNYQEAPFDHFSFKKITGEKQKIPANGQTVLGIEYPEYYPAYQVLSELGKIKGSPIQESKASLIKGGIYKTLVSGENYTISLTVKNTGQSIWTPESKVMLVPVRGGSELGISLVEITNPVEPGQEYTFSIAVKAPLSGSFTTELNLFKDGREFDSGRFLFTSEVRSPVTLKIKTILPWERDPSGSYLLTIGGVTGTSIQNVSVDSSGLSSEVGSHSLLPGYEFDFTLDRPFYQSKVVHGRVDSGVNTIDFGELKPDFLAALLSPAELWKLLPFSD